MKRAEALSKCDCTLGLALLIKLSDKAATALASQPGYLWLGAPEMSENAALQLAKHNSLTIEFEDLKDLSNSVIEKLKQACERAKK